MDCARIREHLGALLDGELPVEKQAAVTAHLQSCAACASEFKQLQATIGALRSADRYTDAKAPSSLWSSIASELAGSDSRAVKPPHRILRLFRRPIAAAASLALLVGVGTLLSLWATAGLPQARAGTVDYSILLDGVANNVDASFERFLTYYHARPIEVAAAHKAAPALSFNLPPELPGSYHLDKVYRLEFGDSPGVAARYQGANGPLIIFFHRPVNKSVLGVHKEMSCHVGNQWGHRVDIGPWKLIHYTDPTTCHCLLSTLDPESEVPAVFAAVAPKFSVPVEAHAR